MLTFDPLRWINAFATLQSACKPRTTECQAGFVSLMHLTAELLPCVVPVHHLPIAPSTSGPQLVIAVWHHTVSAHISNHSSYPTTRCSLAVTRLLTSSFFHGAPSPCFGGYDLPLTETLGVPVAWMSKLVSRWVPG